VLHFVCLNRFAPVRIKHFPDDAVLICLCERQ
jgi:hypothetical protein